VGLGMVDEVLPILSRRPTRIGAATTDLIRSTESHARSIAKAASWRMTGSLDTFIIATLVTGNAKAGGAVALTEILTKTALYYFHERAWVLIPWGKWPRKRGKDAHFGSSQRRIEMDLATNFYPVGHKNDAIIASNRTYADSQRRARLSSSSARSVNQVACLE
jgi:uncharacterized membrane protein